jgi:hypothetical protein
MALARIYDKMHQSYLFQQRDHIWVNFTHTVAVAIFRALFHNAGVVLTRKVLESKLSIHCDFVGMFVPCVEVVSAYIDPEGTSKAIVLRQQ